MQQTKSELFDVFDFADLSFFYLIAKKNIKFLSTAFDLESLDLLNTFNLDFFKVPSGEITNYSYLKKVATYSKSIILSTKTL